jgi:hypothetical protein
MRPWLSSRWIVLLGGLLITAGCSAPSSPASSPGVKEVEAIQKERTFSYQEEPREHWPKSVQKKVNELRGQNETGVHSLQEDGRTYVIVTKGNTPHGGYGIRVEQVVQRGKEIRISASKTAPPKKSVTHQAIDTPVAVISIPNPDRVSFKWNLLWSPHPAASPHKPTAAPPAEGTGMKMKAKIEADPGLPQVVKRKAKSLQKKRTGGETVVIAEGRAYLIMTLGERQTGGYRIKMHNVVKQGNRIHIYAEEVPPSQNSVTTQAISYPVTIASIPTPEGSPKFTFHIQSKTPSSREAME